jgi:hypothetical protein
LGKSFLILPTDFQALSFTSPPAAHLRRLPTILNYLIDRASKTRNARISRLIQAFPV